MAKRKAEEENQTKKRQRKPKRKAERMPNVVRPKLICNGQLEAEGQAERERSDASGGRSRWIFTGFHFNSGVKTALELKHGKFFGLIVWFGSHLEKSRTLPGRFLDVGLKWDPIVGKSSGAILPIFDRSCQRKWQFIKFFLPLPKLSLVWCERAKGQRGNF